MNAERQELVTCAATSFADALVLAAQRATERGEREQAVVCRPADSELQELQYQELQYGVCAATIVPDGWRVVLRIVSGATPAPPLPEGHPIANAALAVSNALQLVSATDPARERAPVGTPAVRRLLAIASRELTRAALDAAGGLDVSRSPDVVQFALVPL